MEVQLDIERIVLSSVILKKNFRPITDKGIQEHYFRTEARSIFKWLKAHVREYREVPTRSFFELKFPDYELYNDDLIPEPTELYLDELRNYATFNRINEDLAKLSTEVRKKPSSVEKMKELVHKLSNDLYIDYVPVREVDIRENEDERLQLLADRANPDLQEQGIRTPWPALNEWITNGGWTPGQLITLVGSLGSGKSFLVALMALEAWLQGKRVLFFTNEMTLEEIQDRVEAMFSHVPTNAISDGTVLKHLNFKEAYINGRKEISNRDNSFVICEDASAAGIDLVRSKIQQYQPDFIVIDGAYLWAETKWEQAAMFTRALKKVAKDYRKPILISWQFNREGSKKGRGRQDSRMADETDLGYSFSLGQDSDIIISCYLNDALRQNNELILKLLKQRQGISQKKLRIAFNHDNMSFDQIRIEEYHSEDTVESSNEEEDDDTTVSRFL